MGFRWRARYAASAVGATGWVCNEFDGSVSMELQGTPAQIDRVLASLEESRYIRIADVAIRSIPVEAGERGFVTRDDRW